MVKKASKKTNRQVAKKQKPGPSVATEKQKARGKSVRRAERPDQAAAAEAAEKTVRSDKKGSSRPKTKSKPKPKAKSAVAPEPATTVISGKKSKPAAERKKSAKKAKRTAGAEKPSQIRDAAQSGAAKSPENKRSLAKGKRRKPAAAAGTIEAEPTTSDGAGEVVALRDRRRKPKQPATSEENSSGVFVNSPFADDGSTLEADGSEVKPAEGSPPQQTKRKKRRTKPKGTTPESELSAEEVANRQFLKGLLEALLFASDKPLTLRELGRAAKLDKLRTKELLGELLEDSGGRGVQIVEVADGFCFRTNPDYGPYVQKMLSQRPVRLSRPQLETLAIVAYRQPVTRPEVDDIRGVDSGQVIKGLLERELVKILGKKDEAGRPMLYGTTPAFLELFNLQSLKELPSLKEFTELSEDSQKAFETEIGESAPQNSDAATDAASAGAQATAAAETEGEGVTSPSGTDIADEEVAHETSNGFEERLASGVDKNLAKDAAQGTSGDSESQATESVVEQLEGEDDDSTTGSDEVASDLISSSESATPE